MPPDTGKPDDGPDLTAELDAARGAGNQGAVQALRDMHRLIEARYEVIAGSRKAGGADGFFAALEHLDLCEPEEFYGDTLPEAISRACAWAAAKEANDAARPVCPKCGTAGCLEDKALDW